jgi:hypothetical protein
MSLKYSFYLFLKCLHASLLIFLKLPTFSLLGYCNHYSLACFLKSKNLKVPRCPITETVSGRKVNVVSDSVSCLAEGRIILQVLQSNTLFYCNPILLFNSASFNYLRLNNSVSYFCLLLTASISLNSSTIKQWSVLESAHL